MMSLRITLLKSSYENFKTILVGTKTDLREDISGVANMAPTNRKAITSTEGQKIGKEIGAKETSAKTQNGLKQLFECVVHAKASKISKGASTKSCLIQ